MSKILAFDPGVTTGITTLNTDTEEYFFFQKEFSHESLWKFLCECDPNTVLYESFIFRQNNKAIYIGVEFIGIIKLWAQMCERQIQSFAPSQSKAFWKDDKIKSLGLWMPGYPHAMDSLRVLLTWRGQDFIKSKAKLLAGN